MRRLIRIIFAISAVASTARSAGSLQTDNVPKPNVIIVITDDQGYGDLACHGNPYISTPNLDKLAGQSVRLDNYHVDTTCAPTRSALLTGRHSNRCGVWHTIQGRNMIRRREITMADIFSDNGYATGIFGKWHLGDVYPYRPEDNGFQHCVYHLAGGVGQAPDYWGNDYFDDTYIKNGKFSRFEGFCTDVWFDEAIQFIEQTTRNSELETPQPFLAYIAPNAPHGPFYCPKEYADRYTGKPGVPQAEFYGMITHIDDNMARLFQTLEKSGIAENTILIFTTDNGTAAGTWNNGGFNAGMRGTKGSQYDGGHRVPFFLRWPGGGLNAEKRIDDLTAHLDILPTLIDLCGLTAPAIQFDGTSLRELLYNESASLPQRAIVVETQRVVDPIKWRNCSVMTDRWRLIDGKELYDMENDPGQKNDVSSKHPETVQQLRGEYDQFWADVSKDHNLTSYMVIGADESPLVTLSSHDWLVEDVAWNQPQVLQARPAKPAHWAIEVARDGIYEISLRRWPVEADKAINDPNGGKGFAFDTASLSIGEFNESKPIPNGAKEVTFRVPLKKGIAKLAPLFSGGGEQSAPYYVYITHKPFPGWQTPQGMGIPVYDPSVGRRPPQLIE